MTTFTVPAEFIQTLTVYRRAVGSYVNGRYVLGAESSFTITGSEQPLTPNEILLLPEGVRTRETRKLYTAATLRTDDEPNNVQADQVLISGLRFKVFALGQHYVSTGHAKVILVEVNA